MAELVRALGTMSGTSLDGIDLALIETDGEVLAGFGPFATFAYQREDRALLRAALKVARDLKDRAARPGVLAEAEAMVSARHAEAIISFMATHGLRAADIDVIGFHGQSVLHRPERGLTIQIGNGAHLAEVLGIKVVHDFRAADVAAGGQGAPFVPAYHRALARRLAAAGQAKLPIVVVNIGGVSNITYVGDADVLLACDTGPGNALLDDFMLARTGVAMDRDGAAGARGTVDHDFLARALDRGFFREGLPKSLDRDDFAELSLPGEISLEDGAATLTAFTAAAIAAIAPQLPAQPTQWIVCGGGAHNPTLMEMLGARLAPARIHRAEDVGWQADAIEAQAFAFLAVRTLKALPLSFPGTTGVRAPQKGGVVAMA